MEQMENQKEQELNPALWELIPSIQKNILEKEKEIQKIEIPFNNEIVLLEERKAELLKPLIEQLKDYQGELKKLYHEAIKSKEFTDASLWDGKNNIAEIGDLKVVAKYEEPREINVLRVNEYCQQQKRETDFLSIIKIPIGACEDTFGKKLTEDFSDYGKKTLKSIDISTSDEGFRKKYAKIKEETEAEQ